MHQQLQRQEQQQLQHFKPTDGRTNAQQLQYARMMGETSGSSSASRDAGSVQMTTSLSLSQAKAATSVVHSDGAGDGDTDDQQQLLHTIEQHIVNVERSFGHGKWAE